MFSMCMGKNGGYVQLGGYDGTGHLQEEVDWVEMLNEKNFRVALYGMSMNDHFMEGTEDFNVGFIDSGTTFTYFPN